MQAAEGKMGRVFVIRLEEGDLLPASIEKFAEEKKIKNGFVLLVGGIGSGQVVVGPRVSDRMPPDAMLLPIDGAHEVVGVGVSRPVKTGKPGCTCMPQWDVPEKQLPAASVPASRPGWWRRQSSMKSPASMQPGF
jgi:hypothetical protein